jgi:CBS domain-containing protein/sporulation protein YlmC with PRC-barrel domain
MIGIPVVDAAGEKIGTVNDLGIATGEVFPRVTSLAFVGPGKTPFMISWRKYVDSFDEREVRLKVPATDIRFSYLQPEEVLIARDLLNKQIVDTRGLRVVRVNDLKLSDSGTNQLRLLGAEVGVRGLLRSLSPTLERATLAVARVFGKKIPEKIIAWSYMDLLDRELSDVQLSVSHKTLDDMHPADIADIIEQLDPRLRGQVFAQLDDAQAALAMAELDDDEMAAEIMGDMDAQDASRMLQAMDPDDAAELVSELDYEKAETLLRLMGVQEEKAIRQLLGYREETAGRIMTSQFVSQSPNDLVRDAIAAIRALDEDEVETVNYIYLVDDAERLVGVLPLRTLLVADGDARLGDLMKTDVISVSPEDDQEDVAEAISKYNLLAIPVVGEDRHMLGIVTVDDALDVLEEEHEEDLQLAGGHSDSSSNEPTHELRWFLLNQLWFFFWVAGAALLAALDGILGLPAAAVTTAVALPVALLLSDAMINYVTGFFIEFDPQDQDAPSLASFTIRGLSMCLVYLILVVLVGLGAQSIFVSLGEPLPDGLVTGLIAAAITAFVGYATAPIYLTVLRRRDEANLDTSRIALRCVAFIVALVLFCALIVAHAMVG